MGDVYKQWARAMALRSQGPDRVYDNQPDNVVRAGFTHPRSLSPYFRRMWQQGVRCPECGSTRVQMKPSLSPDVVSVSCHCGHWESIVCPLTSTPEYRERWVRENRRAGVVVPFRAREE